MDTLCTMVTHGGEPLLKVLVTLQGSLSFVHHALNLFPNRCLENYLIPPFLRTNSRPLCLLSIVLMVVFILARGVGDNAVVPAVECCSTSIYSVIVQLCTSFLRL